AATGRDAPPARKSLQSGAPRWYTAARSRGDDAPAGASRICPGGGIGRHTILRGWRREACEFDSRPGHQNRKGNPASRLGSPLVYWGGRRRSRRAQGPGGASPGGGAGRVAPCEGEDYDRWLQEARVTGMPRGGRMIEANA